MCESGTWSRFVSNIRLFASPGFESHLVGLLKDLRVRTVVDWAGTRPDWDMLSSLSTHAASGVLFLC